MDIEGKYTLPNGEVLEVHVNVSVNTWRDGEWLGFHECSVEEFWLCMNQIGKEGTITFEPKERKEDD